MSAPGLVSLVVVIGAAVGFWMLRLQDLSAAKWLTYELVFPRAIEPGALSSVLTRLSGLPDRGPWVSARSVISIEVVADRLGVRHYLTIERGVASSAMSALRAAVPGVRAVAVDRPRPLLTSAIGIRCRRNDGLLRVDHPEQVSAALLSALQPLRGRETIVLQWLLSPARDSSPGSQPFSGAALVSWLVTGRAANREHGRRERKETAAPAFLASGRVGSHAPTHGRATALQRRVIMVLRSIRSVEAQLQVRGRASGAVAKALRDRRIPPLAWPLTLYVSELVAVLGLPLGDTPIPGVERGAARQLPPPSELPSRGRILLRSNYPAHERNVAMPHTSVMTHTYVLGPTSSGKTHLLTNLAKHDMERGLGVVALDTKRDFFNAVLEHVPDNRADDLIVIDPSADRVAGFNLLSSRQHDPDIVTDQVVGAFARIFEDSWGPRSDDVARATVRTLMRRPGLTLAEVPALLTDVAFRRSLTADIPSTDPLHGFWSAFDTMSGPDRAQTIAPLLNKVRAVLLRERLRLVVGQSDPGWTFESVFADQRIVVVSLDKGRLGADSAMLLGRLMLSAAWQAVLGRSALAPASRRPVSMIVDEFHDLVGPASHFEDFLAQARAMRVGLTLANQGLSQLPKSLRSVVMTNARTKVSFGLGSEDARVMAREFAPHLGPEDLQGLGSFEVAARMAVGGHAGPVVTGVTLPLPDPNRNAAAIRRVSLNRYGRLPEDIEGEMRARRTAKGASEAPIGRRRRQS